MVMEMLAGLELIANRDSLVLLLLATTIGALAAAIPGMGGPQAMALALPFTFIMSPSDAIVFLVAITAATGFTGSVTAILLNLPGDPLNAATVMDGYPMARKGRAGEAIAAAATASALGALFGILTLALVIPFIRSIILALGAPEMFAFALAGVLLVATVSVKSPLKGLISGLFGLLLGTIGLDMVIGEARFTFGFPRLLSGILLVPAVIGLFAFPELYQILKKDETISHGPLAKGGTLRGVRAVLTRPGLVLRSSVIGTGIGVMPGVGGVVSTWVAYYAAQKRSKTPEAFGTGSIEGVIAPEAANDAKEGGTMMPLLALGVPGNLTTAILLGAFLIHGIEPGRRMLENQLDLIWAIILTMVVANVLVSVFGLLFANQMMKVTTIPPGILAPTVVVTALLSAYATERALWAAGMALFFGLLGLLMVEYDYPRPPLLIGLVLLPILEANFHTSIRISRGTYSFLQRPIVVGIFVLILLGMLGPQVSKYLKRKRLVKPRAQAVASDSEPFTPARLAAEWAVILTTVGIAGMVLVTSGELSETARLFPRIIAAAMGGCAVAYAVGLVARGRSDLARTAERRRDDGPGRPGASRPSEGEDGSAAEILAVKRSDTIDVMEDESGTGQARTQAQDVPASTGVGTAERSGLLIFGALAAFLPLLWLLGSRVGVFVYLVSFVLLLGPRRRWYGRLAMGLVLGVVLAFGLEYLLETFLRIPLPSGLLF